MGRGNYFLRDRDEVRFDEDDNPIQQAVYADHPEPEVMDLWFDDLCAACRGYASRLRGLKVPFDKRLQRYLRREGLVVFEDSDILVVIADNQGSDCITVAGRAESPLDDDALDTEVRRISKALFALLHHDSGHTLSKRVCAWTSKKFEPAAEDAKITPQETP